MFRKRDKPMQRGNPDTFRCCLTKRFDPDIIMAGRKTVAGGQRRSISVGFETENIERKTIAIMKVLKDSPESMGAGTIATRLRDHGIDLSERSVRYHLKLMDERGFTRLAGRRDGRVLTDRGVNEVSDALVEDKVGFAISRIEQLAFRTSFDINKRCGLIPVNVSLFSKEAFKLAVDAMRPAFEARLCISDRVAVASEGEALGETNIPQGKVGVATVCSIAINGVLLKTGVPMASKFSGILQIMNNRPVRFVELIEYAGCSLDPSEVFMRAGMTSVSEVAKTGQGRILATYREVPAICRPIVEEVMTKLKGAGVGGLIATGRAGEALCGIRVDPNQVGLVLGNGLNPVAAATEVGLEAQVHGMTTAVEYQRLTKFAELLLK